jgi:TRAP-type mannitol/chloroaromatic compound transport system substrate-binding protein
MTTRTHTRRALGLAVAAATGAIALGAASLAQAQVKLDLSTVWPDSNFHTANVKRFAEEVGKATGGQVQIVVHSGGCAPCATGSCRWPTSSTTSRSATSRSSAWSRCRS